MLDMQFTSTSYAKWQPFASDFVQTVSLVFNTPQHAESNPLHSGANEKNHWQCFSSFQFEFNIHGLRFDAAVLRISCNFDETFVTPQR